MKGESLSISCLNIDRIRLETVFLFLVNVFSILMSTLKPIGMIINCENLELG